MLKFASALLLAVATMQVNLGGVQAADAHAPTAAAAAPSHSPSQSYRSGRVSTRRYSYSPASRNSMLRRGVSGGPSFTATRKVLGY